MNFNQSIPFKSVKVEMLNTVFFLLPIKSIAETLTNQFIQPNAKYRNKTRREERRKKTNWKIEFPFTTDWENFFSFFFLIVFILWYELTFANSTKRTMKNTTYNVYIYMCRLYECEWVSVFAMLFYWENYNEPSNNNNNNNKRNINNRHRRVTMTMA